MKERVGVQKGTSLPSGVPCFIFEFVSTFSKRYDEILNLHLSDKALLRQKSFEIIFLIFFPNNYVRSFFLLDRWTSYGCFAFFYVATGVLSCPI
jgi:hypothetical protein